ncbi:MAG TPA: MarC family protein [Anaeromyxobacteraceae bacterium]|nr:MarC family protein [Anaeromyxobacteraceae bacterium]
MGEVLSLGVVSLSALFFVVDPIAAVPFFLAMTREETPESRRAIARRASVAVFSVLVVFSLAGALIFQLLGISLGAFKIAGGVVLLLLALDMIRTQPSRTRITEGEVAAGAEKEDVAIVPLATPLLAGPGSIATAIVLMARAREGPWWHALPVLAAILAVAVATFLILAGATTTERVVGRTGLAIVERAAGLLLVAVAVQFMLDGLGETLPGLLRVGP